MSSRGPASLELENQRLREEVRELREEVRRPTLKVDCQGDQLQDLSVVVGSLEGSVEPSHISAASAAASASRLDSFFAVLFQGSIVVSPGAKS